MAVVGEVEVELRPKGIKPSLVADDLHLQSSLLPHV